MADAIEQAAAVFQADINGGTSAPAPKETSSKPAELIFGNSDSIENPDEWSDEDLKPDPKPRGRKAKAQESEEEEDIDPSAFGELDDPEDEDEDADPDLEDQDDEDEDEDGDDKDEDDKDEEEFLNQTVTVMVDGQEEEVTLKEALQGYSRTKTFYNRMNQLQGAKEQLTSFAEVLEERRAKTDAMYAEAEAILQAIIPPEPDWDKLFAEDPKGAREVQKQYEKLQAQVQEIRQKRQALSEEEEQRQAQETAEYAKSEFKRFANIAKWRNNNEVKKDLDSMRRTALAVGFTEQEIQAVFDSRMLHVLLKASKYDRMMAAKPRHVNKGKQGAKPGAGNATRAARRGLNTAQKELSRTGSIDAAAAVMKNFL